ncbi:hypothetical protein [Microbacterium sp. NPDC058389]|uniref:hypothetical protein n=1 Tax=Microbacterium sp. NPDC058389 TaxID=3346475 RepID=UPI00365F1D96
MSGSRPFVIDPDSSTTQLRALLASKTRTEGKNSPTVRLVRQAFRAARLLDIIDKQRNDGMEPLTDDQIDAIADALRAEATEAASA